MGGFRAVSGSIERAGSTGWIPRRELGNGNREKSELHQVLLSLALCALCGGPGFRSIAESEADKEGQERKIRFRVRPKPWGSAARPGSMGWAPRGTLWERKQGGRRSRDGLLSHPSVLSVPSVVKIKWEGGRIGGREVAGYYGIFSDYHRGHRGHRGGKRGEVLGLPGGLGLDRESGVHGEENQGGSGRRARRGKTIGEIFLLPRPPVLFVPPEGNRKLSESGGQSRQDR